LGQDKPAIKKGGPHEPVLLTSGKETAIIAYFKHWTIRAGNNGPLGLNLCFSK